MAKRLRDVITSEVNGGFGPVDPGTKRFLELHRVIKTDYQAGSPEADNNLFSGANIGQAVMKGQDHNHGHVPEPKSKVQWRIHNKNPLDKDCC